jgi:Cft2 family RNA processing exonuclease
MRLSFLGAAEEVTGSCYLVETGLARFIVDCGMFQGGREASEKNYGDFAFDPRALDFVLLTHAHIDHSGLLPRLVAAGFRGQVFTTGATADLLRVMLLDAAHIHLAHNLGRRECTIVITGFQAQGTLGRRIVDGAASVRIFGEDVPVRAEVYTIGGLSAHADQAGLLAWLRNFQRAPRQAFVVHGEADTAQIFCDTMRAQLGWNATVPAAHSMVTL